MSQRNSIEMWCVCINGLLDREDRLQCYNPPFTYILYNIYSEKQCIYLSIYLSSDI